MTIKLDKVSAVLFQQYGELCDTSSVKNSRRLAIEGLSVSIWIEMNRVQYENLKGTAFCGGKLCRNTVVILIEPENEQVRQVVANHFKSLIIPSVMKVPRVLLFDEVRINGENLKM